MSTSRQGVLSLYRQILRLHRQRLPSGKRNLGDAYVKEEWRRHKGLEVNSSTQMEFLEQWGEYASQLAEMQSAKGHTGRNLTSAQFAAMSDEQKATLYEMKHYSEEEPRDN